MRFVLLLAFALLVSTARSQDIPLPEHPRPDLMRSDWVNLNGTWDFRFDRGGQAPDQRWITGRDFGRSITVPYSWGAPLSGQPDSADIGWYARDIEVPAAWRGKRVFLVVGASDWTTHAWLDGAPLEVGTPSPGGDRYGHRGGYTPFEFELTGSATPGEAQRLVFRVDDTPHPFKLEGKQGYGPARGIWQTVYLEARGSAPIATVHVTPDPASSSATAVIELREPAREDVGIAVFFPNRERTPVTAIVRRGTTGASVRLDLPGFRWWTLEDPYLYEIDVRAGLDGPDADVVRTYFGMRTVSVVDVPSLQDGHAAPMRYVALNGEPIYLQMALDQAYHPEGFYTFPSDAFIRDEVLRSRQIGLNGMRVHVKIGQPRKLYWADRLGVLIMADVPNSWGEPDADMRAEAEHALRGMIGRDFNHPAIFSWVVFNETWGLSTTVTEDGQERRRFLPETQKWVESMVETARELDASRLVEDNSPCCGVGHTITDLNTWHAYLPGWRWMEELGRASEGTYPGSTWNMEEGYVQGSEPNLNSEFGNVWGYQGSTGDVDWSWDYHRAINAFRMHPRVAGWLYTEHHDVINEWNGYWRYDRSQKFTGMEDLAGMTLNDLHAPFYVVVGDPADLSLEVSPGSSVAVPLFGSFLGEPAGAFTLEWATTAWDGMGRMLGGPSGALAVPGRAWWSGPIDTLTVPMPLGPSVVLLSTRLTDSAGIVRHVNFQTLVVAEGEPTGALSLPLESGGRAVVLRRSAGDYSEASWSVKQWDAMDGLKVNGAGSGFFEYRFPLAGVDSSVVAAKFIAELSAKQLFDKDRDEEGGLGGDYMRGGGAHSPHRNPNAYPMTDETRYASAVRVTVNGVDAGRYELPDDPADHRGILSWHAQLRDGRLREAGSFGYLVEAAIPREAFAAAAEAGEFVVRLSVDAGLPGGLAVYGARFGRYPVEPSVVLVRR